MTDCKQITFTTKIMFYLNYHNNGTFILMGWPITPYSLFIYLIGDLTSVAASKWHIMTPKKNQANSTNMQTDAADAPKSKEKQQQWINKNQVNIKNVKFKKNTVKTHDEIIGRVMGINWRRSIYFCKGSWVSGVGKSIQGWPVEGSLSARPSST